MSYKAWYNEEADYNTNARSYMDYLARHNKFMKVLVEDYEVFKEILVEDFKQFQLNTDETIESFQSRLDNIQQEMTDLFITWLDDGTLADLIGGEVLNKKADKATTYTKDEVNEELNKKADKLTTYSKSDIDNTFNPIHENIELMEDDIEDIYGRISNIVSISKYDVDPTGEVDSYAGFKQALEELKDNEELILHAGGRYLIKDTLEIETDKIISINGNGSTLEFDVTDGKDGLYFKGVHKFKRTLSSEIVNGSNIIQLNNTTGINKGDLIWIKSTEQFNSTREYYKKGGTFTISDVLTSNRLMFTGVLPYTVSTATVDVYSPVTVLLKNINIKNLNAIPQGRYGIHVEFGYGSVFDNIKTDNFMNNIIVRNMYNTLFSHITTGRSFYTGSSESYGLAIYACTHTNIINSIFASGRHGLEISGFENSFKTFIYNVHASFENGSNSLYGFNMHQSAYDVLAVNCSFKGFGLANHATLLNCELFENGLFKISEEANNTNFVLKDCNFHGNTIMNTVPDGFGGAHSARHVGKILIENNTVTNGDYVKLNLGISNVIINYETVILDNTNQVIVTFDGGTNVDNLIFKDGRFTRDTNMLNMPSTNTLHVKNLTFENMVMGARYNLLSINSRVDNIFFTNCSLLDMGYNKPQMTINSTNNGVAQHGKMVAINTDFTLMPIHMQSLGTMRIIASEMPLNFGASNVGNRQQAVFENI